MRTLKFELFSHKQNRYLKRTINTAGAIYNHCIALHKRYYRRWSKHWNCAQLQAHIAQLSVSSTAIDTRKPLRSVGLEIESSQVLIGKTDDRRKAG